jgi:hypothetical protein
MAANPEKGEIDVQIGGVSYVLVMDFNGLIDAQAVLAVDGVRPSVEDILARVKGGDLEAYRALFWGMFRRHHADLSLVQVGELIGQVGGFGQLDALLNQVADQSGPDPRDVKEAQAVRPPPAAATKRRRRGGIGERLR